MNSLSGVNSICFYKDYKGYLYADVFPLEFFIIAPYSLDYNNLRQKEACTRE